MELQKINNSTRTTNALKKKHIHTVSDLLEFSPSKYRFYGKPVSVNQCAPEQYVAIQAKQLYVRKNKLSKRRQYFLIFRFQDKFGVEFDVTLFEGAFNFEKYLENNEKTLVICGRFKITEYGISMDDISGFYPAENYHPHIYPIYPYIKGVGVENLANMRSHYLEMQPEILEKKALDFAGMNLLSYPEALKLLHYPTNYQDITRAKNRLLFNDLLYFSLSLKREFVETPKITEKRFTSWSKTQQFIASLPFSLTSGDGGQRSVLNDIFKKIKDGERVNMLLQGDVGCGKTIVAAALMMYSAENNYQSVLIAPRDVLAKQHYEEIKSYAEKMGFTCVFLGGGLKASEKKKILKEIESGEVDFIVGTHACIAESVKYHNLGAVITDEEHLFGVEQKESLVKKAKDGVHSLSMSATPIPRTMATVIYGDQKEIRVISQKPAGRLPIITTGEQQREKAFARMEEQIALGHQCYVVCPAIEENEKSDLTSIEAVEVLYRSYFEPKGIEIGIVNGKLKKEEVEANISDFVANKKQILISTTVIEVGVNVPNSTVMVIEQADRFGLATLHQLRGRVGRNALQSYCILICEDENNPRVQVMCDTNDGFKIAEADLEQRGSGDLLGTAQSGANKYVEKMLNNPQLFAITNRVADYCKENGLGNFLIQQYEEHSELDEKVKDK